jgi:hypothetical protein
MAVLLVSVSMICTGIKPYFDNDGPSDYAMIRQYLLNESPLYGKNKPKLWIHSEFPVNARMFSDRSILNTRALNQPYLQVTVQSIINHCAADFHVCLIDDDSFGPLLPTWKDRAPPLSEQDKEEWRKRAKCELLFTYGGCMVPNSFFCMASLYPLYKKHCLDAKDVVVVERFNGRSFDTQDTSFMMAIRKHESLRREPQGTWKALDARYMGLAETVTKKPIGVDQFMEQQPLALDLSFVVGIWIPSKDMLMRHKYQWFAVMSMEELLQACPSILVSYIKLSMVNYSHCATAPSMGFVHS